MSDKPYHEMSDAELAEAGCEWVAQVDAAAGWSSAHFSAQQVDLRRAEQLCGFLAKEGGSDA